MNPLHLVVVIAFASAVACGGTTTGTTGSDGGDASTSDAPRGDDSSPGACTPGGSCTVPGASCTAAETCQQCGYQSWVKRSPGCTCTNGAWLCDHEDCGPNAPGTYEDATCTTLRPSDPCAAVGGKCILTAGANYGGHCPAGDVEESASCMSPNYSCCMRPADAGPLGSICTSGGGQCMSGICPSGTKSNANINDCDNEGWCCVPTDAGSD